MSTPTKQFKKFPKILIIIFLSIFILQLLSLIFLLVVPNASRAQGKDIKFKPQVTIPSSGGSFKFTKGTDVEIDENTIGNYIKLIYKYAIGVVGILAAVVLMVGGVIWLTAGGDAGKVTEAKAWIGASLTGLVIALASFMILNTINPKLTEFAPISPPKVGPETNGNQSNQSNQCDAEWTDSSNKKQFMTIKKYTDGKGCDQNECSQLAKDKLSNTQPDVEGYCVFSSAVKKEIEEKKKK